MTYACLLCGHVDADVRMGLVRWEEPIDDRIFEAIPRCIDRVACRSRVENVNRERWPVVDLGRTPAEPKVEPTRDAAPSWLGGGS